MHDERAVESGHCFVTRSARVELVSAQKRDSPGSVFRSDLDQVQEICGWFDIA